MSYSIQVERQAVKFLQKLAGAEEVKITNAIDSLLKTRFALFWLLILLIEKMFIEISNIGENYDYQSCN